MKITNEQLIRLAGLSALLSAICYYVLRRDPFSIPPTSLRQSVTTTR